MQGNIDFTGSLSGSIAGGGGSGSDVTITPTLATGTKIADYTIDSESGSLYAPTPEGLTAELPLDISNDVISIDLSDYATVSDLSDYQEKLTAGSYISIDSNNEISCTPPITNVWYVPEPDVQQDVLIGKFTVNSVTQNVYAPSGGKWDYSTSEVDTGQKWIDGRTIYIKTIELTGVNFNISQNGFKRANVELHPYIPDAEIGWVVDDASYILEDISDTYYYRNFDFWEWEGDSTLATQYVGLFKRDTAVDQTVILTVKYVKGSV